MLHQLDKILLHICDSGRQLLEGQLQLFISLNQCLKPALFFLALDLLVQAGTLSEDPVSILPGHLCV